MGDGRPGPTDAWVTLAGLARETQPHSARHAGQPGDVPAARPARHHGRAGRRDERRPGRARPRVAGWFDAEHRAYGIPFPDLRDRFDRFAEQVEIIDGLWRTPAGETFSFPGEHYQLDRLAGAAQAGAVAAPAAHPRRLGRKRSARLAARFADEFNVAWSPLADTSEIFDRDCKRTWPTPIATRRVSPTPPRRSSASARTRPRCAAAPPSSARTSATLRASGLAGTPAEVVDKIGQLADLGVSRIYLQVLDLTDLEQLELIAAEVLPQL